jgi:hypothetical protein
MTTTRLTWLRNASQSPASTNILGLIERVEFLRKLGIDRERQQAIPASAFNRIAREALKITGVSRPTVRRIEGGRRLGKRRVVLVDPNV